MTFYNGINALKGAFWGILVGAFDCSCYHDSSWVCADEIPASDVPVLCNTIGSGATGSINGTAPIDPVYSSQDCLKFTSSQTGAPVTTSPTSKPIASVNPTKAPTTTSSPTKALEYTLFNGTDTGFCADSQNEFYSSVNSDSVGLDTGGPNCTLWTNHTYALSYCSVWCSK